MKGRLWPWLALAFPILAWGLSFPSIKAVLTEIPPMTLAFGRFVLGSAFLAAWYLIRRRGAPAPQPFSPSDRRSLGLSVVTGITLYFLCENHGVKLIPATAASLIVAGIPILTVVSQRLFFGHRLGAVGLLAALVSLVGAALLIGLPAEGLSSGSLWGYLLMLGAALAWVVYLFVMKPLQLSQDNLRVTLWQMIWGAVSLLPFALAEAASWKWPSWSAWAHLAFQGLACSAAAFLLYNLAMEKLGLRVASMAINLIPVVTAVASYLLLGELLNPWQWFGGALVLAAVVAVGVRGEAQERPRSDQA